MSDGSGDPAQQLFLPTNWTAAELLADHAKNCPLCWHLLRSPRRQYLPRQFPTRGDPGE